MMGTYVNMKTNPS